MAKYDDVPAQLEKAQKVYAFLGSPACSDQVIADLADLTGVPANRIITFFRYGRLG